MVSEQKAEHALLHEKSRHPVALLADPELVQVGVFPFHRRLEGQVEVVEAHPSPWVTAAASPYAADRERRLAGKPLT